MFFSAVTSCINFGIYEFSIQQKLHHIRCWWTCQYRMAGNKQENRKIFIEKLPFWQNMEIFQYWNYRLQYDFIYGICMPVFFCDLKNSSPLNYQTTKWSAKSIHIEVALYSAKSAIANAVPHLHRISIWLLVKFKRGILEHSARIHIKQPTKLPMTIISFDRHSKPQLLYPF